MRRSISLCLLLALSFTVFAALPVSANDDEKSKIESLINEYFQLRQASYTRGVPLTENNLKDTRTVSQRIVADEVTRQQKLHALEEELNMRHLDARTTAFVADYVETETEIIAIVYEWTFIDYEQNGCYDTMGIGIWHRLMFKNMGGHIVLHKDDYDEGYMRSSTYSEMEPVLIPVDWAGITIDEVSGQVYQTHSTAGYNASAVVDYADRWVWHGYDGNNHVEYYNPAYINFNNSGGDCANYVSQCISAGGMPQDSTWHYYFNGPGTSDDDYTTAWIYVPSHRQYFGRFGRTINDPVAADIAPGNPVYINWSGDGSWNHATICVGYNAAGVPIVNCHNIDSWHRVWNYGSSSARYSTVQLVSEQEPDPEPPFVSLNIISPNGGEIWEAYSTQTILWNPGSVTGNVRIELSMNRGASWQTIASNTPNSGYYSWYVGAVGTSNYAMIRITSLIDSRSTDTSSTVFRISDANR